MKSGRLTALVVLLAFTAAQSAAQESAGPEPDSEATIAAEERPCIPADEFEQSSADESGLSEEGAGSEGESALPVCEEQDPANPPDDEETPVEEPEQQDAESEEALDESEVDPGQEFEVDPEDEISEDYPVPLPSDI